MIRGLVDYALNNRLLIVAAAILLFIWGAISFKNLPVEAYSWYLDLRKYGTFVHSGFGLGLERTVGWICGIHHIREAIAFPRTMNRLRP